MEEEIEYSLGTTITAYITIPFSCDVLFDILDPGEFLNDGTMEIRDLESQIAHAHEFPEQYEGGEDTLVFLDKVMDLDLRGDGVDVISFEEE